MPENSLIVPAKLTNGSLHFASVTSDSTVQDVIDSLTAISEVHLDTLGDLESAAWAIQKISQEESGREWEEEELKKIGDG